MSTVPPMLPPIADEDASPAVAAVYDDIRATRGSDFVNDFWRVLAHDPALLKRTWEDVKAVMAPGALDPLVKEMIYVAVSVTNGCTYCINSHAAAARARGMTDAMLMELIGVVGMANETNRLVTALQVPVDEAFLAARRPERPAAGGEAAPPPAGGSTARAKPKTSRVHKAPAAASGSARRGAKDGADAPKAAASRGRRGKPAPEDDAEPQATAGKQAGKARAGANGHDSARGKSSRRRSRSLDT